jgi:zinc transporter ZupT
MIKSGFTHLQSIVLNLLSAIMCLIGFYVGASVTTDDEVSTWIFSVTAGMFFYIALVDLVINYF